MVIFEGPLSREKLRDLRSLDSAKIRLRKGLCIVEGDRSLAEAARTGNLQYLVVSAVGEVKSGSQDGVPDLPCPLYSLDENLFREVTGVKSGTGLLGVARIPAFADHGQLRDRKGRSFHFFLDGIQEPGNVGALIRTAWALGAGGVLLGAGTADPFGSKSVRASAGSVFHIPLYRGISKEELADLIRWGYRLFVAENKGPDYRSTRFTEHAILALGNEGAGLSGWVREAGTPVGIPLVEGADSLNVVVAGGIIAARMAEMAGRRDTARAHED